MSVAAVQARIASIQSSFAAPPAAAHLPVRTAGATGPGWAPTASAPAGAASFAQALAAQSGTVGPTGGAEGFGERVVAEARKHLGTPYVWGGSSPGGFDCSGLLQYVHKQLGVDLPRVSNDQKSAGRPVSAAEARPGDLVFFERGTVDHIGMYVGEGKWLHAPRTGDVVKVSDVDLSSATTIRRIVDGPAPVPASAGLPSLTAPAAPAGSGGARFAPLFAAAEAAHGTSAALLTAVARAESGFDPAARSPAGALGLMQFMPGTARELGIDPLDPAQAVDGAARLLKQHLARFGSTELALAAYNAGPGAVQRHGGIPPYRETQDYVAKVVRELRGAGA